jgi:GTP-binding protein
LGALYGYVLADIPGLIEGASDGKGLGFQFLRHISRTHLLIHCVSVESADPLADYLQVRQEIEKYDNGVLKDKPEVVLLTKTDTRDSDALQQISDIFSKRGLSTWKVSILDDDSIAALKNNITQTLSQQASRA